MKTLLKILLFIVSAALLLFVAARFGWRIMGFSACDDPAQSYVEQVELTDGALQITGGVPDSLSAYVGCITSISDGKLYLGVKHNAFFGFVQRVGTFSVTVPTQGQRINSVYLKGGQQERLVWTREGGMVRDVASLGAPSPVPADEFAASDADVIQASYPFDDADGEDTLCAMLFLGYDAESADAAVAKLCSEYQVIHALFAAGDAVVFDAYGTEQYLILPKFVGTTVTVTEVALKDDGTLEPIGDSVSTEAPLRLLANPSDIVPSAQITVQYGDRCITFNPFISLKDGQPIAADGVYTQIYE